MAATRLRSVLPILRIRSSSFVAGNFLQRFETISFVHKQDSSSYSPLLQKLINSPISRTKAIIDSEFSSAPNDLPWREFLTSLHGSSPQKANLVLEWRMEKFPKDDDEAYPEMLSLCEAIGNGSLAMTVFSSMEARGIQLVTSHFNSLISTSLFSRNFLTAISLYEVMKNSENCKPDSTTYNAFISAYAKLRDLEAAEYWLSAKRECGFPDDAESYETLIQCCFNAKKFLDADRYYQEMISSGVRPTESIFTNMLKIFCEKKKKNNATLELKEILKVSLDSGLSVSPDMASKIAGSVRKHGSIEEMQELIEILTGTDRNHPDVVSPFHESLIAMYAERDSVEKVEKIIE